MTIREYLESKPDNFRSEILYQYADDPATVQKLAAALHYMPEQLREDMRTLYEYLRELEELNQTDDV